MKTCPTCGRSNESPVYRETLNKGMLKGLRQLVEFYEYTGNAANIDKDLDLTYNEQSNFNKLQYFGLVQNAKGEGWYPRQLGRDFIEGKVAVYDRIARIKDYVYSPFNEIWKDNEQQPTSRYVWEIDVTAYRKKKDYQSDNPHKIIIQEPLFAL